MQKTNFLACLVMVSAMAFAQSEKKTKLLDSIFTMMHRQNQFNGSVLIAEHGNIILRKGYGYSDEATHNPNGPSTVFDLASCSKQFTAAAIVLLKRQGKLRYGDKLSQYIPELDKWNSVTIHDLLRHTSGLPEYIVDMPKTWDKSKIATNDDLIRFYAQRSDTLEFKPGSRHSYINTNYALLASIVERVSGKTYADFLSQNIFKPLKMKNTFVYSRRIHPKKIKNYAIGYVWGKNSFTKVTPDDARYGEDMAYYLDGIAGGAKVNSTADDMYKWFTALKNNTFLTKSEFEEMTEITRTTSGEEIPYGFGFDVSKNKDRFAFGHTGSWDGYVTFVSHDMTNDVTIITLQNFRMGAYPFDNIMQILQDRPLTVEYRKKIDLTETELKKYVGTYSDPANKDEAQLITYLDGHLVHNSTRVPWDIRFFPVSANEFQGVRQGGTDGVLRFTSLENGDIKLEMLMYGRLIGGGIKTRDTP